MAKLRFKQPQAEKGKDLRSHAETEPSPQTLPPHFSFEHLSTHALYGLSACTKEEKAALADRLAKLSTMTWAQIQNADRHGLGTEKIAKTSIKAGIPAHFKDDHFLALRFFGPAPMVGYKSGRVFIVLWLDPKFKLYDHG